MRRVASVVVAGALMVAGVMLLRPQTASSSTTTTNVARQLDTPVKVCIRVGPPPAAGTASTPKEVCPRWLAKDAWAKPAPSVYTTTFAPDPTQPTVLAYAAWIRTSTTVLALYPGYKGPGPTALPRGPEMVPPSAYPRLLAAFNSGFYEADGAAGFYVHHTLYFPMIDGLATAVRYTNGTVNIITWTGPARPGPTIAMARQNLPLLVSNGAPTPRSAINSLWGLTLHGVPAVWRTAIGITKQGDLIYAAAAAQTAAGMAHVMVELHCVRAMELDINPEWPIFVTYAAPGAKGPSLFVPNPNQIPGRFLYPSTKDFFAVFTSNSPSAPQPW